LPDLSEIQEKITQWVSDEKWSHDTVDDPKFHFLYKVVIDGQNAVFVGMEKGIDRITIHYLSTMHPDLQNSYKLSPKEHKHDFWYDLKVKLLVLDVGIMAIPNVDELHKIDILHMIYLDAFSRDRFIRSTIRVIDAAAIFHYMWKNFVESHGPI
jgi:hypothetical protein